MKTYIKLIFFILVTGLSAGACKQDPLMLYDEPASIYLYTVPDSMEYSFATRPDQLTTDTVQLQYRIIGSASDQDRPLKLVAAAESTAKQGYHFTLGEAVVKANEFATVVPVYLHRKPGLKDSIVQLILELESNEHFGLGFNDKLRYKLTFTDILRKPNNWDSVWAAYFGTYSEVKFRFLISVTGKSNWESFPFPQDSRYLAQRARNALLEYIQQNGPLIDEFGAEVFFP